MLIMVSDDICNGNWLMLTLKNRLYRINLLWLPEKTLQEKFDYYEKLNRIDRCQPGSLFELIEK